MKITQNDKVFPKSNEWFARAKKLVPEGAFEETLQNEIFDLTWKSTVDIITRSLRLKGDECVLDAGCGWGRIIFGCKHLYPNLRVDGIELTQELITKALSLLSRYQQCQQVRIWQGDLEKTKFDQDVYDGIYSTRVFHYLQNKEFVLSQLYRALKPGGGIFISIPNLFCPYRWLFYHHPLYNILSLKKIMADIGFRDLHYGSYNFNGFVPPRIKRFSSQSKMFSLEVVCQKWMITKYIGGLAYVEGKK